MPIKIDERYQIEKLDAYNVAIDTLRMHECEDDLPIISARLRHNLADKLEREINKWMEKHGSV